MIDGDDLKAMRLNAGITQQGMSKKLECDRRTIHNYELGVSDIPSSRLFQWLKFCKLDLGSLLNQIKEVRSESSINGTSKLLDFMSAIIIFGTLWNYLIAAPLYLLLLATCTAYGVYVKNTNITHISAFILVLSALNFTLFSTGMINDMTNAENELLQGNIVFGVQLFFNFMIATLLIFRVQLSRKISNAKDIKLTYFDGILHWIYLYISVIYLLGLIENIGWAYFELKSWTFIFNNIKELIYVAWALCFSTLLTMIISTIKPQVKPQ